jgi:hypothetical protein
MSFFGRIGNLARGAWLRQTSPDPPTLDEDALRVELARPRTAARPAVRPPVPASRGETVPAPRGPERDADGNIKKTL